MAKRKKKTPAESPRSFFPYWYLGILALMLALAGAVLVSR
jgi:hypothetical protein